MIIFPFAKINIGLRVIRKRQDGYHDIESLLVPIPLHDALEVVVQPEAGSGNVEFHRTGIAVPGLISEDLCMKAIEMVRAVRELPPLRMQLHKVIPTGAGLGGGSSDAAHTLLLLNRLLNLGLSPAELHTMASGLGSDCPFFLEGKPQMVEGRGEVLSPVQVDLGSHWLMLVNPGIHVSTAEVFQNMKLAGHHGKLPELLQGPIGNWQSQVRNDMEDYVFAKHPAIGLVKEKLLGMGALYASMSGSGSTVFGIFSQRPAGPAFPEQYRTWTFPL